MRLSPIDHIFTGEGAYPINFLFVFDGQIDLPRLRFSLEEVLEVFYPAARPLIQITQDCLSFGEKTSYGWNESSCSSLASPNLQTLSELDAYLKSAESCPGENLLEVTITQFKDTWSLGLSLSHCVVDGYSYFMFLGAWSKAFHHAKVTTPDCDRSKLLPKAPLPELMWDEREVYDWTGFNFVSENRSQSQKDIRWETIDYSSEQISALMREASERTSVRLSQNDILCADLFRKLVKRHQSPRDEELFLSCALDYRRVYPPLSPLYFGNAVRGASCSLSYKDSQEKPLHEIAMQVGASVRSLGPAEVERSLLCLESLRKQKGLDAMTRFHVAHPQRGFLFTNLSRLPLLDVNFGGGPPKDFRILTPARRTAVILPLSTGLRVQIAH